jgi:hypothetical protein
MVCGSSSDPSSANLATLAGKFCYSDRQVLHALVPEAHAETRVATVSCIPKNIPTKRNSYSVGCSFAFRAERYFEKQRRPKSSRIAFAENSDVTVKISGLGARSRQCFSVRNCSWEREEVANVSFC